jgi:hypothetical protein
LFKCKKKYFEIIFSQRVLQVLIESLKQFSNKAFKWTQNVLNPSEFPNISRKTKAKKISPKFDKILGCYRLPPLKEISSPRLEKGYKVY